MKVKVYWIDEGGCDIHDQEVECDSLVAAPSIAAYSLAREDLELYAEVCRDTTKVIIEVI